MRNASWISPLNSMF